MTVTFRTIGAATKKISQALAIASVVLLVMVIYTGFVIPKKYMHPWFKWIMYINPIAYAFEGLMANEVHGRKFPCASAIPAYANATGATFVCAVPGSVPGEMFVLGDAWVNASYGYSYSHTWRNLGILILFLLFFLATYLVASEYNQTTSSTAGVLVFRRGRTTLPPKATEKNARPKDAEANSQALVAPELEDLAEDEITEAFAIQPHKDIFAWENVCYDIKLAGGGQRRLLENVSGWVAPGTLTALMGVSGAGKTTLLDVLAHRTRVGVISGDMLVGGKAPNPSFQRSAGYVQQLGQPPCCLEYFQSS